MPAHHVLTSEVLDSAFEALDFTLKIHAGTNYLQPQTVISGEATGLFKRGALINLGDDIPCELFGQHGALRISYSERNDPLSRRLRFMFAIFLE